MIRRFSMPDLGEGLTESELVAWLVAEGDTVTLNQVLAEVETAKALVQVPSPFAGTVARLLVEEGTTVQVGSPIVEVEVADAVVETVAETPDAPPPVERNAVLVGYGPAVEGGGRPARKVRGRRDGARPMGGNPVQGPPRGAPHGPPRATPPVRHLASELGVDLTVVTGTGPGGAITRDDVRGAAAPATVDAPPARGDARTPIRGVRKATAAAMVASAFTAPHVTEFLTVDVTPSLELLDRLRAGPEFATARPTMLAIVAKAVVLAARRTPSINASWDDAAGEIVEYGSVGLGIAVATPRGLLVPVVHGAEALDLAALAAAIGELATTARAGETTPAALAGGTISITNVGVFGVDAGTPILIPGQAGILAMGAVRRTPWEHRGEIALRDVMTLSLSFDHRLVDGEQGSRFLTDVGRLLADPGSALAW